MVVHVPPEKLRKQAWRGPKPNPAVERPVCPDHPHGRVSLDGWQPTWSPAHRRPRFWCRQFPGDEGHYLSAPKRIRHPTPEHKHHGQSCPTCDHVYTRYEGPRIGDQFVFTFHEIADCLIEVGRLASSLRQASQNARRAALRWMDSPTDEDLAKLGRTWESETASREGRLASSYVDVFAPLILKRYLPTEWPKVISIDSKPLKARGARMNKDGTLEMVGDISAGEVFIAYDQTVYPAKPVAIKVLGGRSAAMIRRFLHSLKGRPAWVVADMDTGIESAVGQEWPETVLYHSRSHVRRLLEEALQADGIPRMVRMMSPEEAEQVRRAAWPANQRKEFELHPVWAALRECQRSVKEWEQLKDLAEQHIPLRRKNLRSKIADYDQKVLDQIALADANPGKAVGTGAVEGNIAERLAVLQKRQGRFQNYQRLDKILKLLLLDMRGHANRDAYAGIIRQHFEAHVGKSMADWARYRDHLMASLPMLVKMAVKEAKEEEEAARKRSKPGRNQRRLAAANARHVAAGRPPAHTGTRWAKGGGPKPYRRVKGMVLADFPELMAEWHPTLNHGLDPAKVRAGSKSMRVWWQHQGPSPHEGHLHEWDTVPNDRAGKQNGCPYCENTKVCDGNSLAKRDPDIAREWHPTKNKGRTPDDVIVGARDYAWWKCSTKGCRNAWQARIFSRTKGFAGCKKCHDREQAEKTRAGQRQAKERQRAKAQAKAQTMRVVSPPADDELF